MHLTNIFTWNKSFPSPTILTAIINNFSFFFPPLHGRTSRKSAKKPASIIVLYTYTRTTISFIVSIPTHDCLIKPFLIMHGVHYKREFIHTYRVNPPVINKINAKIPLSRNRSTTPAMRRHINYPNLWSRLVCTTENGFRVLITPPPARRRTFITNQFAAAVIVLVTSSSRW